jgi:hypothetical protein
VREISHSRLPLWIAFVLVHLWLGLENLYSPTNPFGDVSVTYRHWMDDAFGAQFWVGIDVPWVYPVAALLPMMVAYLFGGDLYPSTWLSLVFVLDAIALGTLVGWGRRPRHLAAGWWWVGFLLALGPIAVGRIDAPSVAIALVGMLLLAAHPIAGEVLVTVATWIKVWPVAILGALLVALRGSRDRLVVSAIATSSAVVAVALAFGAGGNVVSFVTEQTGRGLQVEAPVSTYWMWRAALGLADDEGIEDSVVYYDTDILTFQVTGPGADATSAAMTWLMVLAVLGVVALGMRATRRGVPAAEVIPPLLLGLIGALVVLNKVGSPQYLSWFAVPAVLALASAPAVRERFRAPLAMLLVAAVATQIIYPYLYVDLLAGDVGMVLLLTARNGLLVALWVLSLVQLWRIVSPRLGYRPQPKDAIA